MIIQKNRANVILDGGWGSSGKGKLAGYLFDHYPIQMAVCDYMPNAGHTVVTKGKTLIFRQIPVGAAYFGVECHVGPHAAIDVDLLEAEMKMVKDTFGYVPALFVHPLASVIHPEDLEIEKRRRGFLASTTKGGHVASSRKAHDPQNARLARDEPRLNQFLANTQSRAVSALGKGKTLLIETAQGFDLGLNHGYEFPYVTGRDCTVGRALDNAGVPIPACGSIIGCLRTFPIRVGHTDLGQSGPCYDDQTEITWRDVSVSAGREVLEMTTVTKRVRRVFTFSWRQLDRFLRHTSPTHLFLNFVNYMDAVPDDKRQLLARIAETARLYGGELSLLGTGAGAEEMEVYNGASV